MKRFIKSHPVAFIVWVVFLAIVIIIILAPDNGSKNQPSNTSVSQTTKQSTPQKQTTSTLISQEDKEKAKKELDEVINLSKKANLVSSYEFSDRASIVYVDSMWYTQTVQFKKDFMAKIAILKEKITGYRHFEVKDTYSNEKVGEVTAFSGSLEVYK